MKVKPVVLEVQSKDDKLNSLTSIIGWKYYRFICSSIGAPWPVTFHREESAAPKMMDHLLPKRTRLASDDRRGGD